MCALRSNQMGIGAIASLTGLTPLSDNPETYRLMRFEKRYAI